MVVAPRSTRGFAADPPQVACDVCAVIALCLIWHMSTALWICVSSSASSRTMMNTTKDRNTQPKNQNLCVQIKKITGGALAHQSPKARSNADRGHRTIAHLIQGAAGERSSKPLSSGAVPDLARRISNGSTAVDGTHSSRNFKKMEKGPPPFGWLSLGLPAAAFFFGIRFVTSWRGEVSLQQIVGDGRIPVFGSGYLDPGIWIRKR